MAKKERAEEFHTNMRRSLLQRLQDIEYDKERDNRLLAHKIKKLLGETIEFSQRTALNPKRSSQMDDGDKSSEGTPNVIRNLVGSPSHTSKGGLRSSQTPPEPKAHFMNVEEHHEDEEEEEEDDMEQLEELGLEPEHLKSLLEMSKARRKLYKKALLMQKQLKAQQEQQLASPDELTRARQQSQDSAGSAKKKGGRPTPKGRSADQLDLEFKNLAKEQLKVSIKVDPRDFHAELSVL